MRGLFKNFLQADVMRRLHSVGLCEGQLLHNGEDMRREFFTKIKNKKRKNYFLISCVSSSSIRYSSFGAKKKINKKTFRVDFLNLININK